MKTKLTTVALDNNQHLTLQYNSSVTESYCHGYTGGKRDKTLDGHYFSKELNVKTSKNT